MTPRDPVAPTAVADAPATEADDSPPAADGVSNPAEAADRGSSRRDAAQAKKRGPKRLRVLQSEVGLGAALGAVSIAVVGTLFGWMWLSAHHAAGDEQLRSTFLQAARVAAVNLATIDHSAVDADIQRILDTATGPFRDQFQSQRMQFADVVRSSQTTSAGTVSESGIESIDGDHARVLVSLEVKTAATGETDNAPRRWRMRMTLQMVDHETAKVSNVEFVP